MVARPSAWQCRHPADLHLRAAGDPVACSGIAQPTGAARWPASSGHQSAERPAVEPRHRPCAVPAAAEDPFCAARPTDAAVTAPNPSRAADPRISAAASASATAASITATATNYTGAVSSTTTPATAITPAKSATALTFPTGGRAAACRGAVAGPETAAAAATPTALTAAASRFALATSCGPCGAAVLPGAQRGTAACCKCVCRGQRLDSA